MTTSTPTTSVSSDLLPTVRNLDEARNICHEFSSVLTVGPRRSEVSDFAHPDHKIVTFDDITSSFGGYQAPTFEQVKHIVEWGAGRSNLLVHCHAGMSRSTSSAWGIAIANGFDPQNAYDLLYQITQLSSIATCGSRSTTRRLQQNVHSSLTSSCLNISRNSLDYVAAVCAESQQPATTTSAEF